MNTKDICIKTLSYWMGLGIAIQAGTALWPIGNYATLVYWGFYAPLLMLLFFDLRGFYLVLRQADRCLLILLTFFFVWVCITCFWSNNSEGVQATFQTTGRICLLTVFYVVGAAYLVRTEPRVVMLSLCVAVLLATVLAIHTVFSTLQLAMENKLKITLSFRLSQFTLADQRESINAVVSGIYFGALAVIAATFSFSSIWRLSNHQIIHKVFFIGITLLLLLLTISTGTRTAVIALLATIIIFLFLKKHHWPVAAIILLGIWVFSYALFDETSALHQYITRGGLGSLRPQIWGSSLSASSDHLFLGAGMWSNSTFEVMRGTNMTTQPHAHNAFLQLLYWTGLAGFLGYVGLYSRSLYIATRSAITTNSLTLMSFCMLTYFAVTQLFDVYSVITKPSYYWPCVWLPIGITLGLSARKTKRPILGPAIDRT